MSLFRYTNLKNYPISLLYLLSSSNIIFQKHNFLALCLILWWIMKHIVLIAIQVTEIEKIHTAMERVQAYSTDVIDCNCSGKHFSPSSIDEFYDEYQ